MSTVFSVHSHSAVVGGGPQDRMVIFILIPKHHSLVSLLRTLSQRAHTPSDNYSICFLTKEVVENYEDADVGRKKSSKARRQKRKKEVSGDRQSQGPQVLLRGTQGWVGHTTLTQTPQSVLEHPTPPLRVLAPPGREVQIRWEEPGLASSPKAIS